MVAAVVFGAVVVTAAIAWFVARAGRDSVDLPPAMSVAIMPLVAAAGDAETLADALTRDIESGLARGSQAVAVAAHGSAAPYKGMSVDARAIGRELNVRYLVEGEVRRADGRTIVSLQLVDASKASQAWSSRIEIGREATLDDTALARRYVEVRGALFNAESRRLLPEGGTGVARDPPGEPWASTTARSARCTKRVSCSTRR